MERANGWQRAYYIYVWHPLALAVSMPVCVSVSVCLSVDCGAWGRVREVALSRAISNHLLVPHSKPISAIDIQAELVMVYLVPLSMACVASSPPQRPSESGPVTKPEPAWTYQTKARPQARRREKPNKAPDCRVSSLSSSKSSRGMELIDRHVALFSSYRNRYRYR